MNINKSNWVPTTLADVAYWYQKDIPNSQQSAVGIEYYLTADHIDPDAITIKRFSHLVDGQKGPTITKHFEKGDLLLSTRSTALHKAAIAPVAGVTGEKLLVVRVKPESTLLAELLPFVMQSAHFWDYAINSAAGSVNKFTSWTKIRDYQFLLPPYDQQSRLAELLWAAEEMGDKYGGVKQELISALESYRSDLFSVTNSSKVTSSLAVDTKFQEVPFKNLISQKLLNGIYKAAEHLGRGTKIVNMKELFAFPKLHDPEMGLISLTEKEKAQYSLKKGDLLFARRSLVIEGAGKCTIVMDDEPKVFESSIIRVRLDSKKINPLYCFHFLNSIEGKRRMRKIVGYTTVAGITGSDLLNFCIPMISADVQHQIVSDIEKFESQVVQTELMIGHARSVRAKLINQIFSA